MKRRILIIFLALIMIFTALILRISRFYSLACEEYANYGVKGRITSEINKNIISILNDSGTETDNLVELSYDNDGKLKYVNIKSEKLNMLAIDISETIYASINSAENEFGFPIGNTTGIKKLSGKGPNVNVKIIPIGTVNYEFKSEMISGGINQTLYRIKILFYCNISVIAPFFENSQTIETSIVVSEILIVGDVPNMILPFGG